MLTVNDVASRLSVSVSTVRRLIREGKLESVKLGYRTVRVAEDAVQALIESETQHVALVDDFAPIRRRR